MSEELNAGGQMRSPTAEEVRLYAWRGSYYWPDDLQRSSDMTMMAREVERLSGLLAARRPSPPVVVDGELWRLITDDPPLDREFLGANVGLLRQDGTPRPDRIWHIRGRHIDYGGGPTQWTWNESDTGSYGIRLTHWREMPILPKSPRSEGDK